jgi:hypothetical protein
LIVVVVVYITGMEVKRLIQNNILTVGTFVIPKWWVSIFNPLGLLFTSLQFLRIGIYGPPAKRSVEPQGSD